MNWVHVDNLVMAHQLAAESLTPEKACVAVSNYRDCSVKFFPQDTVCTMLCFQNGQAYFINDGESVNIFDWLSPVVSNTIVTSQFACFNRYVL